MMGQRGLISPATVDQLSERKWNSVMLYIPSSTSLKYKKCHTPGRVVINDQYSTAGRAIAPSQEHMTTFGKHITKVRPK